MACTESSCFNFFPCRSFIELILTPYNVGSVLLRLFSTAEAVQYCGGIASVHVGDSISTAEAVQYCGEIASVLRGIASVLQRNSISTAEAVQYCRGITAVHVGG